MSAVQILILRYLREKKKKKSLYWALQESGTAPLFLGFAETFPCRVWKDERNFAGWQLLSPRLSKELD